MTYPGQNTEFYIVVGGVTTGPIVGLVELFRHRINPDTPVWYQGLSEWTPALLADLTRQLFVTDSEFYKAHPEALQIMNGRLSGADPDTLPTLVDDANHAKPESESESVTEPRPVDEPQPKPSSYLVLSIIATVLCCTPAGIVALICSARVNSLYNAGQYTMAQKASETAQTWIAVSIVIGLISTVAGFMWLPFM